MDDDDRDADVQDDDDHDARKQVCKSYLIRSSMVALVQVAPKQISVQPGWRDRFCILKKNRLERLIFNICLLSR